MRISSRKPEEKPKANDQVPKLESTGQCTKLEPGKHTYVKDIETCSALVNCKDDCEITQPLFAESSAEKKVFSTTKYFLCCFLFNLGFTTQTYFLL